MLRPLGLMPVGFARSSDCLACVAEVTCWEVDGDMARSLIYPSSILRRGFFDAENLVQNLAWRRAV
jgi:hypothetical protein